MWTTIDGCQETIIQAWGSEGGTVVDKIMSCQTSLLSWNMEKVGLNPRQIRGVQDKLNAIQSRDLTPQATQYQRQLTNELDVLLEREETLWRQRSRIAWLKSGDKNTKFFHAQAKLRGHRNFLKGVFDSDNVWVSSKNAMGSVFCDYFQQLFSSYGARNVDGILDAMRSVITPEQNGWLYLPFTWDEIEGALFQMFPTKSPILKTEYQAHCFHRLGAIL
ncbi:hypothetical protein CerSpe_267750 [Prunus speciosa]